MSHQKEKDIATKRHANEITNPIIEKEIKTLAREGEIACALAFEIAKTINVTAKDIGLNLDLSGIRINKCQLGLFGYKPEKKIVSPLDSIDQNLRDAIKEKLVDGRLPCKSAWDIALMLGITKITVSRACEAMKIKIKPCQLGAF
jgi:hypothetical protein